MRRLPSSVSVWVVTTLLFCCGARAVAQNAPLTITTSSVASAAVGAHYEVELQATGGVSPYAWQLAEGSKLPPGMHLHPHSGRLSGTPQKPGEYHFTILLSDIDAPPSHVQRVFTLSVVAGITVEWRRPPAVSGTWIAGSLLAANHTDQAANLTVIVVAVNEIGRATALGYQHFTIPAHAEQEIPFGASPGPGNYLVRADAVAHFARANAIMRAHRETGEGELVIQEI